MLRIRRRFTIRISGDIALDSREIVENKMEEFDIYIITKRYNDINFREHTIPTIHYECSADEEKMYMLMEYLKTEYKGPASITY